MPSSVVTFLLTDIEGSTGLWEQSPAAMDLAVTRHDSLAATIIAAHGGMLVKSRGEGDSLFAVFTGATDALQAAIAFQQAIVAEPWTTGTLLRVRMALHSGEAVIREGDYYGTAPNRCARIRSAAHGGQVLCSAATHELVRDQLPERVELLDLGEHRLKDLVRQERLFQVAGAGLPSRFPPLRTLDRSRHNLPVERNPLIGRESEIQAAHALLLRTDVGLLTLTGPGGAGKTRLSLQVAAELLEQFPDGVIFVPLAAVTDPQLVAPAIARELSLEVRAGGPGLDGEKSLEQLLLDHLKDYLRDRKLLLVLDNFEQVIDAAPLVADLLAGAPGLKVLVTSRSLLRVRGEQSLEVPPLALPDLTHIHETNWLETVSQYAAVELFIQRAVSIKPDFTVTNRNAPAVAEICSRLDGLPLAIELAAARIRVLPPEAMLKRLGLKLLTGGARDLPSRQQTLRDAIAWSYDLLTGKEKVIFRRLSVFTGGWTVEAAERVCEDEVLDLLGSLVDKSLVRQVEEAGEVRFLMLETIREFAADCLEESGEAQRVREAHGVYFQSLAEEAEPELWGVGVVEWLDRLEADHDNLVRALEWLTEHHPSRALRLAGSLWWFWHVRGRATEGRRLLERVLSRTSGAPEEMRWRALCASSWLAAYQGDEGVGASLAEESLALCLRLSDDSGVAWSTACRAIAAFFASDYRRMMDCSEESVRLFRKTGDEPGLTMGLQLLGIALTESNNGRARAPLEESLALSRRLGGGWIAGMILHNLGKVEMEEQLERAASTLEESLHRNRALGFRSETAFNLHAVARLALRSGDNSRAAELWEEALSTFRELGFRLGGVLWCVTGLVKAWSASGDFARAESLCLELIDRQRAAGERAEAAAGNELGHLRMEQGRYAEARALYEKELVWRRAGLEIGEVFWMPGALLEAAQAAWSMGDLAAARRYIDEAAGIYVARSPREEQRHNLLAVLECYACVAALMGDQERAGRLLGAVEAQGDDAYRNSETRSGLRPDRPTWRVLDDLPEAEPEAWSAGRAIALEEAIQYALSLDGAFVDESPTS